MTPSEYNLDNAPIEDPGDYPVQPMAMMCAPGMCPKLQDMRAYIRRLREKLLEIRKLTVTEYGCPGGGTDACACLKCGIDRVLNQQEPTEAE